MYIKRCETCEQLVIINDKNECPLCSDMDDEIYMTICPKCGDFKAVTKCSFCNEEMINTHMTLNESLDISPEELEDYTADLINTFFKDTYDESAAKYRKANEKSVFTAEELDRLSKMVACPYCKCYNTKKISTTSKVLHTALFGIFSVSRNGKNYHCDNCGSDF